jgi:hemerythrin-like domain-containing protein
MWMATAETQTDRDVIDLLLEQHDEIKSLFHELRKIEGPAKQELFEDLVRLLAVHETAEETVVHPMARRKLDAGEEVVERRLEEEDHAKKELAALYELGVDHPEFDQRLDAFAADVVRHATKEEAEEFLRLRGSVEAGTLRRMAGAVKAAEAVAPTRPHPRAPESAIGNLLVGPPTAVFDRVRDALADWRRKHADD